MKRPVICYDKRRLQPKMDWKAPVQRISIYVNLLCQKVAKSSQTVSPFQFKLYVNGNCILRVFVGTVIIGWTFSFGKSLF